MQTSVEIPENLIPDNRSAVREPGEPRIRKFDLAGHMSRTRTAEKAAEHIRYGLESWLATGFMRMAMKGTGTMKVPSEYEPRWGQFKQIEKELHSYSSKRRQLLVFMKMPFMGGMGDRGIDFIEELRTYEFLDYHNYYLQPFHSLPGGWLSPAAATGNESAMRALFAPSNKRGCEGLRETLADAMPSDAKVVYDFGGAGGGQAAVFAEKLGPEGRVVCIDPSPFGLILGKKDHKDPRIEWIHGFAEDADLPANSADVVNFLFVLHETPDHIKRKLIAKAYEVLKPGGTVLVGEPPLWDLEHRSRGFFEPYRTQWESFDGKQILSEAGFTQVVAEDLVSPDYMISFRGQKPA